MTDLFARGAAIFGAGSDGVFWPYDASGIDHTLRRTDPERFQQQLAALNEKRLVIIEWAERRGLKESTVRHCCPRWLTRKISRRCEPDRCTQHGTDRGWLDHTICWLKNSRPAVITSAPYHVTGEDRARIHWWTTEHPNLSAAHGTGWYGHSTTQIVLWRTDRIETVTPATAA